MPAPFDAIFKDAATIPVAPSLLAPDRSRFEVDTERSGANEVDARFQLGTVAQDTYHPIRAAYRNRQFQFELTDRILDPLAEDQNLPIPRIISRFLFKPTAFALFAANRWIYSGYRVVPHATNVAFYSQDAVPNLDDPPAVPLAYNTAEFDNDGSGAEGAGMDVTSASYLACNLAMLPIKGGVWPAVRWLMPGGVLRVWFTANNDHDRT